MTRRTTIRDRATRRTLIAISAVASVIVPLGVTATSASWTDQEWVHSEGVGTSSAICDTDTDTGFAATARGDFLSGALLGTNLDNVAALAPQQLAIARSGALTVTPPGSINRGSTPPTYTYTNPLNLSLLGGIAGLSLTGLSVGLPVGSAGAVNQYAQVSGYGRAAAASGLVSDSGGVLVSATTPSDQLPQPATISLASLLPLVTGVAANPRVEVGAVGASSILDGCAALRSMVWGGPAITGSTRTYGIAGLDVVVDSASLGTIVTETNNTVALLNAAVNGLLGPNGAIAGTVSAKLGELLAPLGLNVLDVTGNVSISGLNLSGAVSSLLTQPLNDGVVSINLAAGTVEVNLAALVNGTSGLNGLAPNTELVLNATVINSIVNRVAPMLNTRIQQITAALNTALEAATLTIGLGLGVRLGATKVADVSVNAVASLKALRDKTATITASIVVLPDLPFAVQLLLNPVLGLLNGVIAGLGANLLQPISTLLTTTVFSLVNTLGTTLAAVVTPLVTALAALLAPLPTVLSVRANVQPDRPFAPPGTTFIAGTPTSTPEYSVSALRIGVGNGLGGLAYAEFGTASAGPVAIR